MTARPVVGAALALEDALLRARRERRLALVFFDAPSRPLGREMQEKTLRAPAVAELLAGHFVFVPMDPERESSLFARLVGGRGALASVVLDETGDVLALQPGYLEAPLFEALLRRTLDAAPSLRALRAALTRRPMDPALQLRMADLYHGLPSPQRAQALWMEVAARSGPDAAHANERLARLCVERGENREARQYLEQARRSPRDVDGARMALTEALLLMLERRVSDARQRLTELLVDDAFAEADHVLWALGLCEHELKDDARAIATLERLLRRHPRSRFVGAARIQLEHIRNPEIDHQH